MRSTTWLLSLLCTALAAGCYSPSYGDCQVSCASGVCPSGLDCLAGMCRVSGMTGACGATGDAADAPAGDLPLDMLRDAEGLAVCTYLTRCGAFEDVPSCQRAFASNLNDLDNQIAAVAAGTVVYHPDKARTCLDSFAQLSCERDSFFGNRGTDPSCRDIFTGTIDNAGVCGITEQCVSQLCKVGSCTTACCPGKCMGSIAPGTRAIGDPCTSQDTCTGGYCAATSNPPVCAPYKTQGTGCSSDSECGDGLACRNVAGAAPTCQMLAPLGGTCSNSFDCLELSNVCRGNVCVVGGLMGDTCATAAECQIQHACTGGKCGPLPVIGQSCQQTAQCLTGFCEPTTQLCTMAHPDGDACNPQLGGRDCASTYCETLAGATTCRPKPICN